MTEAQERLKEDIEKITDDALIEKVRIFIMGLLTQQGITDQQEDFNLVFGSSKE